MNRMSNWSCQPRKLLAGRRAKPSCRGAVRGCLTLDSTKPFYWSLEWWSVIWARDRIHCVALSDIAAAVTAANTTKGVQISGHKDCIKRGVSENVLQPEWYCLVNLFPAPDALLARFSCSYWWIWGRHGTKIRAGSCATRHQIRRWYRSFLNILSRQRILIRFGYLMTKAFAEAYSAGQRKAFHSPHSRDQFLQKRIKWRTLCMVSLSAHSV